MDFGGIVGLSKLFLQEVARRGDVQSLVGLSNYIFKCLCLDVHGLPVLVSERTLRACQELHYWANMEIHDIRTRDLQYYRIPITLDGALAGLTIDRTDHAVVFTFLTENYLENLAIWLDMYQRSDPPGEHLIIMAIGKSVSAKILDVCRQKGMNLTKVFEWNPPCEISVAGNGMDLAFLWYVKMHVVANLVGRGLRVAYSDLDAYWIKDFFSLWQDIHASTNADLVISPTFDMPSTAILHWTFAPCAGFFSVEPTQRAKEFLGEWRRMTEVMYDDQIGLSELLFRGGIVWRVVECPGVSLIGDAMMKSGRIATLAIHDPEIVKRVGVADPESIGNATIWHPRWVMNPAQHIEAIGFLKSGSPE
jgi:Nucleotide-diphospho-sugar transferase